MEIGSLISSGGGRRPQGMRWSIIPTISCFAKQGGQNMGSIKDIDPVLKLVRNSVRQFGLLDGGPIGQQILLLGDSFYGYRFTSKEFTAVWSAVDQTLNVFDQSGRHVGSSLMNVESHEQLDESNSLKMPELGQTRRAA